MENQPPVIGLERIPARFLVPRAPRRAGIKEVCIVTAGTCIRSAARIPGISMPLARLAAAMGSVAPPELAVKHGVGFKRSVGDKAARMLFAYNPRGARELIQKVAAREYEHPDLLEHLARHLLSTRLVEEAVALRERALELEPSALRHLLLAQALEALPRKQFFTDPLIGITEGHGGRADEAIGHVKAALALEPNTPIVLEMAGRALVADGRYEEGVAHLERCVVLEPTPSRQLILANALALPQICRFDDAARAYEAAAVGTKERPRALTGLLRSAARGEFGWDEVWAATMPASRALTPRVAQLVEHSRVVTAHTDVTPDEVAQVLSTLRAAEEAGEEIDEALLRFLFVRLGFLGYLEESFSMRQALAREALRTSSRGRTPSALRRAASALVYLDRAQEAVSFLEAAAHVRTNDLERLQIEKLLADAHLAAGDRQPLIDFARQVRENSPLPQDKKMRDLIAGRRVALVGPANTDDLLGDDIDSFDVVIRPRYAPEFVSERAAFGGSRTDITYYSGRDIGEMLETAGAGVDAGALKLVVARPLAFAQYRRTAPPWLRFYRHDFSLGFESSLLGINRIIYDLIPFEPAEITLFHADMYAGTTAFAPGYRGEHDIAVAPGSIINDLFVAHDLMYDFKLLQRYVSDRILNPKGIAAEVLALDPSDYIERVRFSGNLA